MIINKVLNKVLLLCVACTPLVSHAQNTTPLRIAVVGVSHGHLAEVVNRIDRGDFVVVGVSEINDSLRANNPLRKKLPASVFYKDLGEMLDKTKPEVVVAYGSIYDHLAVVQAAAPRHIAVMVEKPLAVNMEAANKMAQLARDNNTLLLTNYETTWYSTNHEAYKLIKNDDAIGRISRMEIYDGHEGPIEINCGKEFTDWLTDPKLNGGGAVIDFGCYGANLATWLMNNEKPTSVYAVLKQFKPNVYPKVDDDATILLNYPSATVQIMGSWCWPTGRKDMHIYGSKGYIYQDTPTSMRTYIDQKYNTFAPAPLKAPYNDSFYYLKAAVRGDIKVKPNDLSSLENNLIVVGILDAAIQSAKTGQAVKF